MTSAITKKELNELLGKLRTQYDDYSEKYGKSFFNKQEFENRYLNALHTGMDLQGFLLAEIAFFEELKNKLSKIKEKEYIKKEKPFTKKVEATIREWEKQWKKYPCLFSHIEISEEAQYFLGAITAFYNEYWLNLVNTIDKKNLNLSNKYHTLSLQLQKYINSINDKLPYEVELYVLNIHKSGVEQAHMVFLKNGALLMKEIKQFIDLMEQQNIFDALNKLPHEWDEETKKVTFQKTKEKTNQIISDFRFKNLI